MACNRASGRCIGLDEAAVSSTACAASVDIPTGTPCFSDRWRRIRLGARHSAAQSHVEPGDFPHAYLARRMFIHSGRFATQGFPAQRNLHAATRFHIQMRYRDRLLLRLSTSPSLDATQRLALVSNCSLPVHGRAGQRRPIPFPPLRTITIREAKKTPPFPGASSSRVMTWCCSITARSQSSSSEHSWPGQGSWP